MAKKPLKPDDTVLPIDETDDETEVDTDPLPPRRKPTPMIEPKLDLSPVYEKLDALSSKLETVLNPKPEPKPITPIIAPSPEPLKPESRKYRLFDEFDPSIPEVST